MNLSHLRGDYFVLDHLKFDLGELVMTIMGNYGIVVGFGKHLSYPKTDKCDYYHVLIDGEISCYLPFSLKKIKNT